jgi:hypothetical protein
VTVCLCAWALRCETAVLVQREAVMVLALCMHNLTYMDGIVYAMFLWL